MPRRCQNHTVRRSVGVDANDGTRGVSDMDEGEPARFGRRRHQFAIQLPHFVELPLQIIDPRVD